MEKASNAQLSVLCWCFFCLFPAIISKTCWAEQRTPAAPAPPFGIATQIGRIETDRLLECSGLDASTTTDDLFWAINDGEHGPILFALRGDGRDRGRVRVAGAINRDWEGIDTFFWKNRPMILIADFGDNDERHKTHTLYVVQEPILDGERLRESTFAEVVWRIIFTYPDGHHDAEGVAVSANDGEMLILTKRDQPPLLFALPLKPAITDRPVVARMIAVVGRIPPPSIVDRLHPYGSFRRRQVAIGNFRGQQSGDI